MGYDAERIESQEERTNVPEKMEEWNADHKPRSCQEIGRTKARNDEYRPRRLQRGSWCLTRDQKRINRALKSVGNTKGHADDHHESRSNDHARDCSRPARVSSEFPFEKVP